MIETIARINDNFLAAIVTMIAGSICASLLHANEPEEARQSEIAISPAGGSSRQLDRVRHPDIKIGAIRFDYWYRRSTFAPIFSHAEVNPRTPWFGEYESPMSCWKSSLDDQWVMDRDVKEMEKAGIDWVAANWFHSRTSAMPMVDSFVRAVEKTSLSYALVVHARQATDAKYRKGISESLWSVCRQDIICKHLHRDAYLRVDGRPVVLLINWSEWEAAWPSPDKANAEFDKLADESVAAGFERPYFILLTWLGHRAAFETLAQRYGVDAFSAYAHSGPEDGDRVAEAFPYQEAINRDAKWREDYSRNVLGLPVIPNVMTGWDPSAMWVEPSIANRHYPHKDTDYYEPAEPEEIVANIDHAVDWLHQNPQEFMGILIYAWNEVLEGGYLMETKQDGRTRLEALQRYLKPNLNGKR